MPSKKIDESSSWYLEGFVDAGRNSWRTVIHSLPLTVGREKSANLQLRSPKVSHHHAEIYFDGGLRVRDLGSTNGTYVNGRRVRGTRGLATGDVIRFADLELRLASYKMPPSTGTKALTTEDLKEFLAEQSEEFLKLLRTRAVRPLYQPLFDLRQLTVVGYELLCRGNLEGFETAPTELFFIAERLGCDIELSQLFRHQGVESAARLPGRPKLFVNTHPSEIQDLDGFLASIARLNDQRPEIDLVVEIHEAAMTEPAAMRQIRSALHAVGIELAFDDFGTGQSRLQALADVPPDYLKFDLTFVRGLDRASERRKILVRRLVEMATSIGIAPIAEGIETPEELRACTDAGFQWAQGYLLAEPLEPEAVKELTLSDRNELLRPFEPSPARRG
jgi:EAL domain-containing protein (putative c-di-GMP-specific phosphodiesterase class I)